MPDTVKTTDVSGRVRNVNVRVLSDNHYTLRRADYELKRSDGTWQKQARESYDMGDGAGVLPYDKACAKVILIRQFRWPVFERGQKDLLVEVIAGKLDGDAPEICARREAMEEAGVTLGAVKLAFRTLMSPGAVTEELHLYLADYDSTATRGTGGGHVSEGEDIEVLEMTLDEAWGMVESGTITDGKTIMLLQAAKLRAG